MKLESVKLEYTNPLVNKYLNDFSAVQELFAFNPYNKNGFAERLEKVGQEFKTDRDELVRVLLPYNRMLGCSPQTEQNIELLKDDRSVVIITGQQAGVFTGPLYTIHKTISVIQLAQKQSAQLGVPVIPVFWVAAEDHDYQEVNHLDIINREGNLSRLTLDYEPEGKFSVGHIPMNDAVFEMIDALADNTNPAEWKEGYLENLRNFARESENLADWFARIMAWLFKHHGLVVVNPLLPGLRRLMAPLFERFILSADAVNKTLGQTRGKVIDMGFTPQVDKSADHLHLFRYIKGERLPLLKEGNLYTVRGQEVAWSREELLADLRDNPQGFSPNVVLRPVAQDAVLPLLAYVAGPGEIAYYALYKDIYPLFDMTMPIIYPRANLTLLEGNIIKLMDKYNLQIGDVIDGLQERQKAYLKELAEIDIDALFSGTEQQVSLLYKELNKQVAVIDPAMVKYGEESLNKVLYQVNYYRDKVYQGHRKKNEIVARQFDKIGISVYPNNNYQERVLNIFPFLFKHGPELLERLIEMPLLDGTDHKLVTVNP